MIITVCRNVHANMPYCIWNSILEKIFNLHKGVSVRIVNFVTLLVFFVPSPSTHVHHLAQKPHIYLHLSDVGFREIGGSPPPPPPEHIKHGEAQFHFLVFDTDGEHEHTGLDSTRLSEDSLANPSEQTVVHGSRRVPSTTLWACLCACSELCFAFNPVRRIKIG